jgi:hypothetical protein
MVGATVIMGMEGVGPALVPLIVGLLSGLVALGRWPGRGSAPAETQPLRPLAS